MKACRDLETRRFCFESLHENGITRLGQPKSHTRDDVTDTVHDTQNHEGWTILTLILPIMIERNRNCLATHQQPKHKFSGVNRRERLWNWPRIIFRRDYMSVTVEGARKAQRECNSVRWRELAQTAKWMIIEIESCFTWHIFRQVREAKKEVRNYWNREHNFVFFSSLQGCEKAKKKLKWEQGKGGMQEPKNGKVTNL